MLKIAIVCGGPSAERGISINTARSILDHLDGDGIEIAPIYLDRGLRFHIIPSSQLYSNTPSDFDFKLKDKGWSFDSDELLSHLRTCDLVFPCVHGAVGEDGKLQSLLEEMQIPFVGSPALTCQRMFNKDIARQVLASAGYETMPALCLTNSDENIPSRVSQFFEAHDLTEVIVKPAASGSSIGVTRVAGVHDAVAAIRDLFDKQNFDRVIVERFLTGREFSVVVLQNAAGEPVALPPTSIEWSAESIEKRETIYTYGKKYMPKDELLLHCPADFSDEIIEKIRKEAEAVFVLFGMRDMARLDGWLLESDRILFTDLNPISGMEQNSYFFVQASRIGFNHRDLMLHIVNGACRRHGLPIPQRSPISEDRQPVRVLFGGDTAERQVSLMSGTNVWLKLGRSQKYDPTPCLLDKKGDVWRLPYAFCINHTVEEIYKNCVEAENTAERCRALKARVRERLLDDRTIQEWPLPVRMPLEAFFAEASDENSFVFLALHGGEGENGAIQKRLDDFGLAYNGSGPAASALCMDKLETGARIESLRRSDLVSARKRVVTLDQTRDSSKKEFEYWWAELLHELSAHELLVKPRYDGCSAGIVKLDDPEGLWTYFALLRSDVKRARVIEINNKTVLYPDIPGQPPSEKIIDMDVDTKAGFLIEPFIEVDSLSVADKRLKYERKSGWLELTVGVLEQAGVYHSLSPSITIAENDVLSVEEKFQGGTGVNITPPPADIISEAQVKSIKARVEQVARCLGIQNYARIDVFFNTITGVLMVIEANSLPGLTPSTVIYHQALAEKPPLFPREFLEHLILAKLATKIQRRETEANNELDLR